MRHLTTLLYLFPLMCIASHAQSVSQSYKQKQAIQGAYLADVSAMGGDIDMMLQYGKYIISADSISSLSWDGKKKAWVKDFTVPHKIIYQKNAGYMTGYNIVFQSPYGYEVQMCTGDVNNDGKMDLWSSDSLFYTKQ